MSAGNDPYQSNISVLSFQDVYHTYANEFFQLGVEFGKQNWMGGFL